jgi:hypothetical protein
MARVPQIPIVSVVEVEMEKHVVKQQERKTPFEERKVQSLDFLDAELPTRREVAGGLEEKSRTDEEERNVE